MPAPAVTHCTSPRPEPGHGPEGVGVVDPGPAGDRHGLEPVGGAQGNPGTLLPWCMGQRPDRSDPIYGP